MFEAGRPKGVGAPVQRLEDPRLLAGQGQFVDDIQLPRTLHAALLRSDHAHARIDGVQIEAAKSAPGVRGVFLASDFDVEPLLATSRMPGYHATPLLPLARGKVRYVGEPIAVVVAEDRYLAEDALALIEVDASPLPAVTDARKGAAPDAPVLHDGMDDNLLVRRDFAKGDVDAAFSEAAHVVSDTFRMHRKSPLAMENRAYLAEFDKGRGRLTLWASTQVPGVIRDALAGVLGMPGAAIRVLAPDVGGGFGGKASLFGEELLVALLARRLGRPVKWTSDRREDLLSTSQAFDETVEAELAIDGDGRLLGLRALVLGDAGAGSIYPWTAALEPMQVAGFLPGPYDLPNYAARVAVVATNKTPTGPYRGVGRPPAAFVLERLIDMAAKKAGLDPAEMRRLNLVQPDGFPYKTGSGIVWDKSGFVECLDLACDQIGYENLKQARDRARHEGRWVGIGLASYAELTGIGSRMSAAPGMPINTGTETAIIEVDASGGVTARFGVASHGQGLETTLAQIVAEEMGVRPEDVRVVQGDTDAVVHSTGTYASRSMVLAGGAAHLTGAALREKVFQAAGFLMEAAPEDLEIEDGVISAPGTNKRLTLAEVANAVYSQMGRFPPEMRKKLDLTAQRFYDPQFGTTTSATHIAYVEIDPETYQAKIERYVAAEDCGRVVNPLIVDGQVHGGVAQGVGVALLEEVVYDETGQNLTASLVDYTPPSATEIPAMDVAHLDARAEGTIGGYRGMGEGGTIGAPAAIANAIADALSHLNIQINELPATPERLFRLVRAAQQGD